MDRVEQYRGYIKQLLTEYASYKSLNKTIERQFVCDTENDHYQIVNMGWDGHRRIYGCTIHIDIKNGKIWIQHNMTEIDLAQELVSLGVSKRRYCAWVSFALHAAVYRLCRYLKCSSSRYRCHAKRSQSFLNNGLICSLARAGGWGVKSGKLESV